MLSVPKLIIHNYKQTMKNQKITNGLSLEELQERNEFTNIPAIESCEIKCLGPAEPSEPSFFI
jgi:hypothetical protein